MKEKMKKKRSPKVADTNFTLSWVPYTKYKFVNLKLFLYTNLKTWIELIVTRNTCTSVWNTVKPGNTHKPDGTCFPGCGLDAPSKVSHRLNSNDSALCKVEKASPSQRWNFRPLYVGNYLPSTNFLLFYSLESIKSKFDKWSTMVPITLIQCRLVNYDWTRV